MTGRSKMPQVKKSKPKSGSRVKQGPGKGVPSGSGNNAFYILVIVVLITVIVLLINRYSDKGMFRFPSFHISDHISEKSDESGRGNHAEEPVKGGPDLEKDENLSGDDKKNSETIAVQEKEVSVYFLRLDDKTEKIYLSRVKRKTKSDKLLEYALDCLVKGPTKAEESKGFISAVPASLRIRSIRIKGNIAEIDFSGAIEEGAAGDILLKRVQQIVYTATEFNNIEGIVILINGKRRKSMGSDGFSISGPLRR